MDEIFAANFRQRRDPHRRWMRHTYQEGLGFRFLATRANCQLAAGSYVRHSAGPGHLPFAIDVLRIEAGRVAEITTFLRPDLFAVFGLPPRL